jgi:hypothetical protein
MIQKVEHPSKRLLFSPFSRSQLMAIANYWNAHWNFDHL